MLRYASGTWSDQLGDTGLWLYDGAWSKALGYGCVTVLPPSKATNQNYTGSWLVIGPRGETVNTVATTTQGLQEAINYAALLGAPLHVFGRAGRSTTITGDPTTYPVAFFCSTPVVFPPMFMMDIEIDGANIIYTGPLADAVMIIKSCMMVNLRMSGEIITDASPTPPLLFRPEGIVPLDGSAAVITSSRFEFGSVGTGGVTAGSAVAGIIFDCANGSIISNHFEFVEAECSIGHFTSAMLMRNAGSLTGSTVFSENTITFPNPHGFLGAGIAVGGGTVAGLFWGANYRGNVFILSSLRGGGASSVGINCYGNNNTFIGGRITGEAGGLLNAIVCTSNDSGAGGNQNEFIGFSTSNLTGADWTDNGKGNYAVLNGRVIMPIYTVAQLPAAATSNKGSRATVTDASATTFASVVAGGGANGVPVYSDGTNWRIG